MDIRSNRRRVQKGTPWWCCVPSGGEPMKTCLVILMLALTGCSSTGVVPMDKNTYMVAKRSAQLGFGPADGPKADVYREAKEFCAKQNKEVETVALNMTDSGFARPARAELQFRCIDANGPDLKGAKLIKDVESRMKPARKSDVDDLPSEKYKSHQKAYALVIGIEQYRQKLPSADFAAHDAKIMSEYLTKVLGYPEENVITLTNEQASIGDFIKYFEKWLPNHVEKDSTVFVYYSGHGTPNPNTMDAYIVPYDGDPTFIEQTGYSLTRMYNTLAKLPAKEIVVVLDSCFSGAGGRSVLAKGARPIVISVENPVLLSQKIVVIAASSGDQISSTYEEKGHGLFTYFILKGLKNEDVIKPDGSIMIGELFGYVKPQVERLARRIYNNEQSPQIIGQKH